MSQLGVGARTALVAMPFTSPPFYVLNQFAPSMPRDLAQELHADEEWEECDERRRQNRRLYVELVASKAKLDQLRVAVRITALVCRMGSGLLLLPVEAVLRVLDFAVVQQFEFGIPAPLVSCLTPPARSPWRNALSEVEHSGDVTAFGKARVLLSMELYLMETTASYLQDWVTCADNYHTRVCGDILRVAARHTPAEACQAVCHLPLSLLIKE